MKRSNELMTIAGAGTSFDPFYRNLSKCLSVMHSNMISKKQLNYQSNVDYNGFMALVEKSVTYVRMITFLTVLELPRVNTVYVCLVFGSSATYWNT